MSRSASTTDRTAEIARKLKADFCKGEMLLYVKVSGSWVYVDDLDTGQRIKIFKSAKRFKYANYNLTPLASSIGFSVINDNGKYSEGSGETVAGYFDLDTEVQIRGGYVLEDTSVTDSATLDLTAADGLSTVFHFYTELSGGNIILDIDGPNADGHFQDLYNVYYDTVRYNSSTYTPGPYFVASYDLLDRRYKNVTNIDVTANSTNGTIFYSFADNPGGVGGSSTAWTSAGATVSGTKSIAITTGTGNKYVKVAVIWDGVSWSGSDNVSDISIDYIDFLEIIYKDNFLLDSPSFTEPEAPQQPRVQCAGRDKFKRAIDTDLNTADLSGGKALDQLVKDICDSIGIPYTAASIADLSSFGNRVLSEGYKDQVKAEQIFDNIMQVLNKEGFQYQMYLEFDTATDDNILFVQPIPSDIVSDFTLNYHHYQSLGSKQKNYDKLLKRLTVFSDQKATQREETLDTTTLSTDPETVTWTGDAEYKRVVENSGSATPTITDVSPTSITFASGVGNSVSTIGNKWAGKIGSVTFQDAGLNDFSVRGRYVGGEDRVYTFTIATAATPDTFNWNGTGGGGSASGVSITGDWQTIEDGVEIKWNATTGHTATDVWSAPTTISPPVYEGEWINYANITANKGNTARIVNPLVLSDAECKSISQGFLTKFGSPSNEARALVWPYLNLILEQNDMCMIWSRFIFLDDLYFITGIEYSWTMQSDRTSFTLSDSGLNFTDEGNIIYDRNDLGSSATSLIHDGGLLYDMQYGPQGTEADANTTFPHNIDFT